LPTGRARQGDGMDAGGPAASPEPSTRGHGGGRGGARGGHRVAAARELAASPGAATAVAAGVADAAAGDTGEIGAERSCEAEDSGGGVNFLLRLYDGIRCQWEGRGNGVLFGCIEHCYL
jgi:hypothetical protein